MDCETTYCGALLKDRSWKRRRSGPELGALNQITILSQIEEFLIHRLLLLYAFCNKCKK